MNNTFPTYPIKTVSLKRFKVLTRLKRGVWLYFFLLVFEGALRKWIFPGLSSPLLVVRDPVALGLLLYASLHGYMPKVLNLQLMILVTLISFALSLVVGHGNLSVAIFGARITLIHFPLIFLIGNIFTIVDVVKLGRMLLWISIPMTLLMALQFYSPQSAWVNRGLAGDVAGAGFSGANGFFRPPGTFSFIAGLSAFYILCSVFIFYFAINYRYIKKLFLIAAGICLVIAIPLSISRTLFFSTLITLTFGIFTLTNRPKLLYQILGVIILIVFIFFVLSQSQFMKTGIEAFVERLTSASEVEGGLKGTLGDRFLGSMFGVVLNYDTFDLWGKGLGMGTNVGAKLLTGHNELFLISESEWGRLVGEMGLFLGLFTIFLRVQLVFKYFKISFSEIKKENILPWMLMSFAGINLLQGQWGQPTILGFSVLSAGLVLASLNKKTKVY